MTTTAATTSVTAATILSGFPLRARVFGALMRREFLEHKMAFFTTPLVLSVLMLGIVSLALVVGDSKFDIENFDGTNITIDGERIELDADDMDDLRDGLSHVGDKMAQAVAVIPATPLLLILPFIIVFPMLGALYEERRDRSYLFWKSMPVSDTEEVLAKLAFIAIVGPLVVFAFMMVLGFATTLVATPFLWLNDLPAWDLLWSHFAFVTTWSGIAANYLVWALWGFPLFAWILLASAYAPKAPLMYAVLPPVVIGVIEAIVLDSTRFFETIGQQLGGKYGMFIADRLEGQGRFNNQGGDNLTFTDAAAVFADTMTSGAFWMGTGIGVIFIAGAIWTRRYNV